MHATAHVTCELCGRLHVLERQVRPGETFRMVCHSCEEPLRVDVPTAVEPVPAPATPPPAWLDHLSAA